MNKIKAWIVKYSKEILIGVVVSIVTTWIINGIDWIKEIAPTAGNSVLKFFLNYFYGNLATTSETSILYILFYFVLAFYIVFLLDTVFKGFSVSKERIKLGTEVKKSIESAEKGDTKEKDKKKTLKQIKDEAETEIKEGKKLKKYAISGFIFVVFYFLFIIISYLAPNIMWKTYRRDIIKITPYVEQQEIYQIESNWVCMKSKEDYDAIYKFIDDVKEKHDLP